MSQTETLSKPELIDIAKKRMLKHLSMPAWSVRQKLALTCRILHSKGHESGLAGRFPEDSLCLLNAILNDQPWIPRELGQCLEVISQASPALLQDHRYQRLDEYFRRRGV